MNRITLVRDDAGERTFQFQDYPLAIGGVGAAIPLGAWEGAAAYVGQERGHPFIQPVEDGPEIWHNHERLTDSAWLKSGDQIQIENWLLDWQVQGGRIVITLVAAGEPLSAPPSRPPPVQGRVGKDGPLPIPTPVPDSRISRWLTLLLFSCLLLAALFVLLATPVMISIEPQPSRLSLSGSLPVAPLPGRMLALPGQYTLVAEQTGYTRLEVPVTIEFGKARSLEFSLNKLPGIISLKTLPEGADLTIDGIQRGKTPVNAMELAAGHHELRLELPRYQPLEAELEVVGMGRRQDLSWELTADWATVGLTSEPAGAEISEAGRVLGRTPVKLELEMGHHDLVFRLPGFKPHRQTLVVEGGVAQELPPAVLTAADGRLHLNSSPEGGVVSVDGVYRGLTPLQLVLAPGEAHLLRVTKAGFQPMQRSLTLKPDEELKLDFKLDPLFGVLFITSEPADAALYVDGQPGGSATNRLKLPAGSHRIEVRKPGYQSYGGSIEVAPGGSHDLEVVLKPKIPATTGESASRENRAPPKGNPMVRIDPSPPFTMGASRREPGRRANENLRQVELTRPYLLGTFEVSNGEFRRFRPGHDSGEVDGVSLNGDRQPVVNVSWAEAARYLNWLSRKESLPEAYREQAGTMVLKRPVNNGYRLPSEAEWARAARFPVSGMQKKFPWPGDRPLPPESWGNYADSSAAGLLSLFMEGYNDGFPVTAPVGSFRANELGVHDLDGNVAEWMHDFYSVYPGAGRTLSKDPMGPDAGRHHVVRGAGWRDASLSQLRLSYRDYSEKPRNDLGFRVARYVY